MKGANLLCEQPCVGFGAPRGKDNQGKAALEVGPEGAKVLGWEHTGSLWAGAGEWGRRGLTEARLWRGHTCDPSPLLTWPGWGFKNTELNPYP